MKKSTFWKLMLMLLPLVAVGLATMPDSVKVYNLQTGAVSGYAYFDLAEGIPVQAAAPVAALLSLASGVLAAVYLGAKKPKCLKGIEVCSFLASLFAVMPFMFRGEILVVPHVLLPIAMLAEAFLARSMIKKPIKEEKEAPRLNLHR